MASSERRNRRAAPAREEKKREKKTAGEKIAAALEMPPTAFGGSAQIELAGNREAVVEGCKGILEYDDSHIRLNIGSMTLAFSGRNLAMRCMAGESVIIEGYILKMEFIA